MAVFIIGCGGGGSGAVDGGTVTSTQKALKVLPDQVVPGTFITIEDDSIREDSTIEVTFSDPSGFEVVLDQKEITEESIAKIAVPPLIDVDTGNLKTGKLTVALPNGRHKTLTVEALPHYQIRGGVCRQGLSATGPGQLKHGFVAHDHLRNGKQLRCQRVGHADPGSDRFAHPLVE